MVIDIKSEVAGTIFEVLAQVGSVVGNGDPLLVIESMKMEIPVDAPAAGTVSDILVSAGEVVSSGQVLIRLQV